MWWDLAFYGLAACLALQTLVSLMVSHKRRVLNELLAEERQRRQLAAQAAAANRNDSADPAA